jgi:hypothetical protein
MNASACIIAACAANARARKKEEPVHIHTEELYYKVTLRKYYYFKPTIILGPSNRVDYPVLNDDIIPVLEVTPVVIGARAYALMSSFSVKESMCPKGIDKYIKDNLDSITSTDEWKARHAQVLANYCVDIKHEYGIDIDPTQLNYTTEYYWEVK